MKLLFTPEALASFNELKSGTPREADRVRDAIKDILAHPASGSGTPVALVGALSGLWCRYYGVFHQIVYAFDDEEIKIFAIGKNLIESAEMASGNDVQAVRQSRYSEEEYRHVLEQMEARRGKGETPKVGIFWYSVGRDELFGVVSHPVDDYSAANASEGRITCSELHEDVWKKEFRRQRYKEDGAGLFIGAYQDKPRGRIFYCIENDTYEVATGKWLQEYPHVYQMILREFDLPPERTSARYAVHWDIGQSWR